jgi:hypothetical protein
MPPTRNLKILCSYWASRLGIINNLGWVNLLCPFVNVNGEDKIPSSEQLDVLWNLKCLVFDKSDDSTYTFKRLKDESSSCMSEYS